MLGGVFGSCGGGGDREWIGSSVHYIHVKRKGKGKVRVWLSGRVIAEFV